MLCLLVLTDGWIKEQSHICGESPPFDGCRVVGCQDGGLLMDSEQKSSNCFCQLVLVKGICLYRTINLLSTINFPIIHNN